MHDPTITALAFMAFSAGAMCGAIIASLAMWNVMTRDRAMLRADLERIFEAKYAPKKNSRRRDDDESWR